jgi:hypothetical protein
VSEAVLIEVHGIVIHVPVFLAASGSVQVILGCPWDTYACKCERNLDDGSCKITITAVDGLEQVMFVATYLGDQRDWFASNLGNYYA